MKSPPDTQRLLNAVHLIRESNKDRMSSDVTRHAWRHMTLRGFISGAPCVTSRDHALFPISCHCAKWPQRSVQIRKISVHVSPQIPYISRRWVCLNISCCTIIISWNNVNVNVSVNEIAQIVEGRIKGTGVWVTLTEEESSSD